MNLSQTNTATDAEYAKKLKRKLWYMVGVIALGAFTILVSLRSQALFGVTIDDHQRGFYSGFGSGLVGAGLLLCIKTLLILKNPKKLHTARIEAGDERVIETAGKAIRIAFFSLLILLYCVMLIGGLYVPQIIPYISWPVSAAIFIYVIAYFWLIKKA